MPEETSSPTTPQQPGRGLATQSAIEKQKLQDLHWEETDRRAQQTLERISSSPVKFRKEGGRTTGLTPMNFCSERAYRVAADLVEAMFRPATPDKLQMALFTLRRMTAGRDGEVANEKARAAEIVTWVRQLQGYPADVAISVLQDWPKRSKWWPTWFELQEQIDIAMSQRRVIKHVLSLSAPKTEKTDETDPESPERRKAVVDECLKRLAEAWTPDPLDPKPKLTPAQEREQAEGNLDTWKDQPPKLTVSTPELSRQIEAMAKRQKT